MNYKIIEPKCMGCSYCRLNCKFNSIIPNQFSNKMNINLKMCVNCGICIKVCPVNAILYC